ncbi:type II toxin-antitoxin system mRNA interferase toxin, RelE/StbE family [Bdellovibrio sp. BCCA]|uniref:type II toxin-antitoxin system mRNA interferase toxin, RelE/StbE family n=1 Tax=Bdellovibrio sp. BCCA TaxID=3136281 RepID=UPI004040094E
MQEKYEFWKNVIQISGPDGLRAFKGFKDHSLKGEWQGYRSSYLSESYRVIYTVERDEVRVYVIDVNHHDYRRR